MSSATTTLPELEMEFRNVPIAQIRDPKSPARESMDEDKFLELCQSIADLGLIEPLVLEDCNVDFEVIAGHRRLLACRAVGLLTVPCMIRRNKTVTALSIMIHENAFREDMNPVEEGRFYLRALEEECGGDVDKLCAMLKRDRNFVEGRILLLQGYPKVVAALEGGHISIAVSRLLNKCQDPNRLLILLDMAMAGGANARQVADWVRDANGQEPIQLPAADPEGDALALAQMQAAHVKVCTFCGSKKHPEAMESVWAHNICLENFRDAQNQVNGNNHE